MTIEHSPLLPHELARLRESLMAEMNDNLIRCASAGERAAEARRKARGRFILVRWILHWRARSLEQEARAFGRRAVQIRKALKNGDEATVGHRAARRMLHRQIGGQ